MLSIVTSTQAQVVAWSFLMSRITPAILSTLQNGFQYGVVSRSFSTYPSLLRWIPLAVANLALPIF